MVYKLCLPCMSKMVPGIYPNLTTQAVCHVALNYNTDMTTEAAGSHFRKKVALTAGRECFQAAAFLQRP